MSNKYTDRFSSAISELETHNAYVCVSCNSSRMKSTEKRDHTRHEQQGEHSS